MSSDPSVLIVGAGFGGLAAAIELVRHGHRNVTILEKSDGLGGVWRDNTYPGAACDAPSDLYSFSFAPNTKWPKRFAEQPAILAYMQDVAARYGIVERIRFGVEVTDAEFDADRAHWLVRTSDGAELTANVFVPAVGQLSRPTLPNIPGRDRFAGAQFHSARWNHDVDLTGKRVAVVGTGASAIQIVPAIAPQVAHLTVFQRSVPWIMPKFESWYLPAKSGLFRLLPVMQTIERRGWWSYFEFLSKALDGNVPIREALTTIAGRHRRSQVTDPTLRAALKPVDAPGCKRGLMSNDFYPALMRDNTRLETARIAEITSTSVITDDGTDHPVDVIVYCTGFSATDFLMGTDQLRV
ncbi:flavin-containing monooxygenase [Smaragdicoccus niigatensis]|uniref:flavin-containing monooxygenase n=3 Tax=Smaragdicoccus niigatensis TaxID=359359 RepID=UPI000369AC92|nr:NAD(P)/FAD-dependent oxidoreductase [Smaragdicoccus niigatensis]